MITTPSRRPRAAKEAKSEGHAEFHAQYALECAAPGNLTAIEFGYFRAFAGRPEARRQCHHAERAEQVRGYTLQPEP